MNQLSSEFIISGIDAKSRQLPGTKSCSRPAALRSLKKPVDLLVLNSDEHVLADSAARIISQGGAVDWFSFLTQSKEDPDPTKVEQYARWRELRNLQEQNSQAPIEH